MVSHAVSMDSQPVLPAWPILSSAPIADSSEFIRGFLEVREDDSWLLLTSTAVAGERQLWVAWLALQQRSKNDTMRSVGQDGEFLRLIAGTHRISQGFRRAGLCDGDEGAWLVHLPPSKAIDELPVLDFEALEQQAETLAEKCGFTLTRERPQPTAAGLVRLGVFAEDDQVLAELIGKGAKGISGEDIDGVSIENGLLEDFFIGHIHTSDIYG